MRNKSNDNAGAGGPVHPARRETDLHNTIQIQIQIQIVQVAQCTQPGERQIYTISFRSFSPMPGSLEFEPGKVKRQIQAQLQRKIQTLHSLTAYSFTIEKKAHEISNLDPYSFSGNKLVQLKNLTNLIAIYEVWRWSKEHFISELNLLWFAKRLTSHHFSD